MTTHERLEEVFQTVFADDTITLRDDMTARDIPQWDSVNHINLMFSLEQAFNVQFRGNELAEFENIAALKRYLEERGQ